MGVPKVMIVDDSPFSRTILADVLQECNCEVVGEADSIDSLIETYIACKPDIVTMDIAMPVADGFECSKALRAHDPAAKIILVSSMKDEETEAEARRIGVTGYVQKPVDAETLSRIIANVMAPDTLYGNLEQWSMEIFKEALSQSITRMTKTTLTFNDMQWPAKNISQGIASSNRHYRPLPRHFYPGCLARIGRKHGVGNAAPGGEKIRNCGNGRGACQCRRRDCLLDA